MKYTKYILSIIFSVLLVTGIVKAVTVLYPGGGGTGTTQVPTYGKVLVGQTNGTYLPQATSTLGIGGLTSVGMTVPTGLTVSGSPITTSGTLAVSLTSGYVIPLTASTTEWKNASSNWTFSNNYGVVNLTGSSTMPWWAQGGINASSTSNFVYASTTALTVSGNSYLGTVSSGVWNGTAIGDAYLTKTGDWTGTIDSNNFAGGAIDTGELIYGGSVGSFSELAVSTNGFVLALSGGIPAWVATSTLSTITGTLTVAKGGTGQTSFGQGWLHSDGATLTSSTSPTVNYITATSTAATSTFSGDLRFDAEILPDGLTCANGEILKKTGANDWDCAADSTGTAVGTVSTSTVPTIGNLAYWTSAAYPSLLGTVSTSTIGAGTGLAFSGTSGYQVGGTNGTFSVNTSQNIATLSNLTSNGFVKTGGGAGTLSVDTNTYLTTVDISANTNLASTWPVILTGDTLSFGGLSTSTAAVIGNLPYFSGVNTFANVATSTPTVTAPITYSGTLGSFVGGVAGTFDCTSATGSVKGCLASADWTTFNNKQSTISTTYPVTLSGATIASAFGTTTSNTWASTQTFGNITGTGVNDFGDATSVEITNNGTVNANGEITTDDTSGQLRYYAGSAERVIPPLYYPAFQSPATTTAWTGTTTAQFLGTATIPENWTFAECYTDVGTVNIQFSDGTNNMNMISASATPAKFALTTNNSFSAGEKRQYVAGTPATSPTKFSCTITKSYDAD